MKKAEFKKLLHSLAVAWTRGDHDTVCKAFAENVHYSDPTRYTFRNLTELRAFFGEGSAEEQHCEIHATVFDEEQQLGAAEYTYAGKHRYHGLVLIKVATEKIIEWREYQHIDDRDWGSFVGALR